VLIRKLRLTLAPGRRKMRWLSACRTSGQRHDVWKSEDESKMPEIDVIANQKQILRNQKAILANQKVIIANQETIKKNQATILKNQSTLDTIVTNQKTILSKLK
jgi:hypothetical protein